MPQPFFLRDIYNAKRESGDADAEQFRAIVQHEFTAGLSATVMGAAVSMRRWVAHRPSWISDLQHARRVAVLNEIEAALFSAAA